MNKQLLKKVLPSPALCLIMLFLPIALSVYYVVTQFSDNIISNHDTSYYDVQNNFLQIVMFNHNWNEQFNRVMDFAFWGMAAFIVMVLAWGFGAAKISLKNHYAQEDFKNFRTDKASWHGRFFVIVMIRFLLIALIVYGALAIVGKQVPQLSFQISELLSDNNLQKILPVLGAGLAIWLYQLLIVTAVKLFQATRAN